MPPFEPMLLGRAAKPPVSPEWSYELKYDGWRAIVEVKRNGIAVWSRNGYNLTQRFSELHGLHKLIAPSVLDCELVVLDDDGCPRFDWMHRKNRPAATLVAFDVLRTKGRSIIDRSLAQRRTALEELLPADLPMILRSRTFDDGLHCWQHAKQDNLKELSQSVWAQNIVPVFAPMTG